MQGFEPKRPPFWLSLSVCVALTAVFTYIRLGNERLVGPTLGLPLLVCLWCREKSLLWGMTLVFTGAIVARVYWMPPPEVTQTQAPAWYPLMLLISMQLNVWVVAVVVHLFIGLHESLERRNATLEVANAYLESTNKELMVREKRISQQNEELVAQQKRIESMSRELAERRGT